MTDVLFTDEFETWWDGLSAAEQDSVDRVVRMLIVDGPVLRFPYSSGVEGSAYSHMRELRIQHQGRPYRVPGPICVRSRTQCADTHWRRQNRERPMV
jgi:hypothetical protein